MVAASLIGIAAPRLVSLPDGAMLQGMAESCRRIARASARKSICVSASSPSFQPTALSSPGRLLARRFGALHGRRQNPPSGWLTFVTSMVVVQYSHRSHAAYCTSTCDSYIGRCDDTYSVRNTACGIQRTEYSVREQVLECHERVRQRRVALPLAYDRREPLVVGRR